MPRPFDHAVLAAHDLAAQKALYERLGFFVGARNRHPWGTENHIIQFPDTFIELISMGADFHAPADPDPHLFSFAGFVHDYLQRREGFAMLALHSENAQFDHDAFKYEGIGDFEPFHFERHGKSPDGRQMHVAFTLAFVRSAELPAAGFFTCQQHAPENFWNAAFQVHPNGVTGIQSVTLLARDPSAHLAFLANFTDQRSPGIAGHHMTFDLSDRQILEVCSPEAFAATYLPEILPEGLPDGAFAAVRLSVQDIALTTHVLAENAVPVIEKGGMLIVPPQDAMGLALIFSE